jgi:hypothetical protein
MDVPTWNNLKQIRVDGLRNRDVNGQLFGELTRQGLRMILTRVDTAAG